MTPLKPNGEGLGTSDLTVVVDTGTEAEVDVLVEGAVEDEVDIHVEALDLVDHMRALDIAHFAKVSPAFMDAQHVYMLPSVLSTLD